MVYFINKTFEPEKKVKTFGKTNLCSMSVPTQIDDDHDGLVHLQELILKFIYAQAYKMCSVRTLGSSAKQICF